MNGRESRRMQAQSALESASSPARRNAMGQFATPPQLARQIVQLAVGLLGKNQTLRFLDPAFGTGAFYSALLDSVPHQRIEQAAGFEVDPQFATAAQRVWAGTGLRLQAEDFTISSAPDASCKANLLICNPPYVRHHHLPSDRKRTLQKRARQATGLSLGGLSGLYGYFWMLAHQWMAGNAVACWLVPGEFLDVHYGRTIRQYLRQCVHTVRIHRFDPIDLQFGDALVSSAVVLFQNEPPTPRQRILFSHGGDLIRPELSVEVPVAELDERSKWWQWVGQANATGSATGGATGSGPRLDQLFTIRRGLATGCNAFFILPEAETRQRNLPSRFLQPILPGSRHLASDVIRCDAAGLPLVENRRFLLDCRLPEDQIQSLSSDLWQYLQEGRHAEIHLRYLCRHRRVWYWQEVRPPPRFLCTYMGRRHNSKNGNRPFRFILNLSRATAANGYLLLYPKASLANYLSDSPGRERGVWEALNAIPTNHLASSGRVYGGGLHKLEPRELGAVRVASLRDLSHQR